MNLFLNKWMNEHIVFIGKMKSIKARKSMWIQPVQGMSVVVYIGYICLEEWGGWEWWGKIFLGVILKLCKYPSHILCVGRWCCLCLTGCITWVFKCLLLPTVSVLPSLLGSWQGCWQGLTLFAGLGLFKCALDDLLLLSPAVFVQLGVGRAFPKSHLQADLRVICLGVLLPFILCLAFLAWTFKAFNTSLQILNNHTRQYRIASYSFI